MSPDLWLSEHLGAEYFSGNFEHLKNIVQKLDLYPHNQKIITVAGTNGKGETCRFLSDFIAQKHSVKTWTSPHLKSVVERFQSNKKNIDPQDLINIFDNCKEMLRDEFRGLSYFEFLFLSFLLWNKQNPVDYLVLEVGLGGRLDATNVIDTHCAVVCSISRDHQHLLGNRYSEILYEKLGIARQDVPLITCFELHYLQQKTKLKNQTIKAQWIDLFMQKEVNFSMSYSQRNFTLAKRVCEILHIDCKTQYTDIYALRSRVEWQGITFDLFPSHNVDGLRKLVQFLREHQYNNYDLVMIAFSKRSYQDLNTACRILLDYFGQTKFLLVDFDHVKSLDKGLLHKIQDDYGFERIKADQIFSTTFSARNVLVTGSNYFLGTFLQLCPGQK